MFSWLFLPFFGHQAVVSAPCKIDRFILQDDPNESLVVWLVCGQDLFSAHISPVGASLPQDAASLDSKKSFNSKKRPHESASDDPTPKRGTPSQRAPPSSVSHRMAPQPRLVDATHAKRIVCRLLRTSSESYFMRKLNLT